MNNFEVLFHASPQPMWVFDVESLQILEVNAAAIERYGYSRREFLKKTIRDLRPDSDKLLLDRYLPQLQTKTTHYREFRHITKSGQLIYVEVMSHSIVYNGINARVVVTHGLDEQKAMLGKLEFTQTKLQQMLESTSIGFLQIDRNYKITYWNNAAEEMIGYGRDAILGKNILEVFPEIMQSDIYTNFRTAVEKREIIEFEGYFWPVQKWVACNAYPVDDGVIIHFRDVSIYKLAEEVLVHKVEKLMEISFLNSHYVRKPIASLLGLTNLVKDDLLNLGEFKMVAEYVRESMLELDDVVKTINAKVNNEDDIDELVNKLEVISFNDLVNDVIAQIRPEVVNHVIVLKHKTENMYYGHRNSIAAAIRILIHNAAKYSPQSSEIIITTELIDQNIVLSVQDFGTGIEPVVLNKIYQSFTNKAIAKELGSHLEIVSDIAHKHNGSVWVESEPEKGATVSIRFPLSNIAEYKINGRIDFSVFKPAALSLKYDKVRQFVNANWKGFQGYNSIKVGCSQILETLTAHNCTMLLNDNTNLLGTWEDAVEWVATTCMPMMEEAGLKYVAWIYSRSTFSKLSVDRTLEMQHGNITVKTFNNRKEAVNWLVSLSMETVVAG